MLALTLLSGAGIAKAQDVANQGSVLTLSVRVVDGHIVVLGYIYDRAGDVFDVALEISLGHPGVLTVDPKLYKWLENPATVKLVLKPGIQLQLPIGEVEVEGRKERSDMHSYMTILHSNALESHKVSGVLGLGFLRRYHLALDVAAGTLTLSPLNARLGANGDITRSMSTARGWVSLPMDYADGKTGELALSGEAYDTYIDSAMARSLGKPAGDVSPVWLGGRGGVDLSAQMALRPGATFGATVVAGVNFFEAFRVELDWKASKVGFTPTARRPYPHADFAYFQTEIANTAAAYQSYLERFPSARLSMEAAGKLLDLRLKDKDSSDEQLMDALKWLATTAPADRKLDYTKGTVDRFRQLPDRAALVTRSGLYALEFSRSTVSAQVTYRLHNIIGEAYLQQGMLDEAWGHLLSAAFMPLDKEAAQIHNLEVNLNLARTYDRMGRAGRAYSRYRTTQMLLKTPAADGQKSLEQAMSEVPDDVDLSEEPPETQRVMKMLKVALREVGPALERLRRQIPAAQLEMLEG